jgi:hypothetical protein
LESQNQVEQNQGENGIDVVRKAAKVRYWNTRCGWLLVPLSQCPLGSSLNGPCTTVSSALRQRGGGSCGLLCCGLNPQKSCWLSGWPRPTVQECIIRVRGPGI